jgi:hypothetical protein
VDDLGKNNIILHLYKILLISGYLIVIFCDSKGLPKLTKYLKYLEYIGVENKWKIVVSELDDFKFAPMILKHRHAHCDYLYEENRKR